MTIRALTFLAGLLCSVLTLAQNTVNIGNNCSVVCINGDCRSSCGESGNSLPELSGIIEHKRYWFDDFDAIAIAGNFSVELLQSDETKIEVIADSSLFDEIDIQASAGKLSVSMRSNRSFSNPPQLRIALPRLAELVLSGTIEASLIAFRQDQMSVRLDGVTTLNARGHALALLRLEAEGSHDIVWSTSEIAEIRLDMEGSNDAQFDLQPDGLKMTGQADGINTIAVCGRVDDRALQLEGLSEVVPLSRCDA